MAAAKGMRSGIHIKFLLVVELPFLNYICNDEVKSILYNGQLSFCYFTGFLWQMRF